MDNAQPWEMFERITRHIGSVQLRELTAKEVMELRHLLETLPHAEESSELRDRLDRLREGLRYDWSRAYVLRALDGINDSLQSRPAEDLLATGRATKNPAYSRTRVDWWLRELSFLIPRRYRKAVLGDLCEDIAERRREGWPERWLLCFVSFHLALIVLQRLKFWTWFRGGFVAWLFKSRIGW